MPTATSPMAVLDRFRRPEYTGENRCMPCTAVNVVIALAAGVAVGAAWPPAGAIVLAGGLLAIYLRGYLVPGTPTLTRTYFPDSLLRRFGKEPRRTAVSEVDDPEAVEEFLVAAGALEECDGGQDLCLTAGFRESWYDRIAKRRDEGSGSFVNPDEAAGLLDVDPEGLEIGRRGEAFVASLDGARIAHWESRGAYVADIAAAAEIGARDPAWDGLGFLARTRVLGALRLWLDRCPSCDGPVGFDQEVVESCCRSVDVVAATCQECGTRLFEAEHDSGILEA